MALSVHFLISKVYETKVNQDINDQPLLHSSSSMNIHAEDSKGRSDSDTLRRS